MENEKNNIQFSSADIQKYLEGKLSSGQMHAIEKAALLDPFLADAIEGMELKMKQNDASSFESDTDEIKNRLQEKINAQNTRTVFSLWWKVAAGFIFLVTSLAITYSYLKTNKHPVQTVAVTEKKNAQDTGPREAIVTVPATPDSAPLHTEKEKTPAVKRNKTSQHNIIQDSVHTAFETPAEAIASDEAIKSQKNETASVSVLQGRAAGVVVEKNAEKKAKAATDESLNEVVVTGYGVLRRGTEPVYAVPVDGWDNFNAYINENKASPAIDTLIKGNEKVSFRVNLKGRLSDFRIIESLSPAHDSMAVNLIKKGPAWKVLKGNKRKVTVIIPY